MARAALSLLLVFHLFCVLLAPNAETHLGKRAAPIVEPYLDALGLSSSWSFFAPEPGPPPLYLEWEALGADGKLIEKRRWPDSPDPYFLRERQNRRIAFAGFLNSSDERARKVMGPYLCRTVPGARLVKLWRLMQPIPSLTDVASGRRRIGDEVGSERRRVREYACESPQ